MAATTTFGSRSTPTFIMGQPPGSQIWKYRGVEIELQPLPVKGFATTWRPTPARGGPYPYADPSDALGHARFAIDAEKWIAAGPGEEQKRSILIDRLMSMTRRPDDRKHFGYIMAAECRKARRGRPEYVSPEWCRFFDGFPLRERTKLLDATWADHERWRRGQDAVVQRRNVGRQSRKRTANPSRHDRRRLLSRILRSI